MINLTLNETHPLGDRIDSIFLAHTMSVVQKERVNLIANMKDLELLNEIVGFGDVVLNQDPFTKGSVTYHYGGIKHKNLYLEFSKQLKEIPYRRNTTPQPHIKLPEKFVTAQWDAAQLFRTVDRWDKERIDNIESWYKTHGWEIVRIGGEGQYKTLSDIVYVLSKADLHIGADSGMMHIAKFLMPIENIHVYLNIRRRENDDRFPDGWNVSWMAREILRRGAFLNFCENINPKYSQYFSGENYGILKTPS